jgi:hypothetical protein
MVGPAEPATILLLELVSKFDWVRIAKVSNLLPLAWVSILLVEDPYLWAVVAIDLACV